MDNIVPQNLAYQLPLFPSKPCTRCGKEKLLKEFPKDRTCKDGHYTFCIDCKNKKNQEYYATHAEERQQYQRDYYATAVQDEAHRIIYRNHAKQRTRNYRARHPERTLRSNQRNNTNRREQQRTWRRANQLKVIEKDRRRKAHKQNAIVDRISYKHILERDGMYCYICEKDILPDQKMHFDHVIPISRGGTHTEDNIKPTHKQCNLRKHARFLSEMHPYQRRGVT